MLVALVWFPDADSTVHPCGERAPGNAGMHGVYEDYLLSIVVSNSIHTSEKMRISVSLLVLMTILVTNKFEAAGTYSQYRILFNL
jgi:hypothetical protein